MYKHYCFLRPQFFFLFCLLSRLSEESQQDRRSEQQRGGGGGGAFESKEPRIPKHPWAITDADKVGISVYIICLGEEEISTGDTRNIFPSQSRAMGISPECQ